MTEDEIYLHRGTVNKKGSPIYNPLRIRNELHAVKNLDAKGVFFSGSVDDPKSSELWAIAYLRDRIEQNPDTDGFIVKVVVTAGNFSHLEGKLHKVFKEKSGGVYEEPIASFDDLKEYLTHDNMVTINGGDFTDDQLSKLHVQLGEQDVNGKVIYKEFITPVKDAEGKSSSSGENGNLLV